MKVSIATVNCLIGITVQGLGVVISCEKGQHQVIMRVAMPSLVQPMGCGNSLVEACYILPRHANVD